MAKAKKPYSGKNKPRARKQGRKPDRKYTKPAPVKPPITRLDFKDAKKIALKPGVLLAPIPAVLVTVGSAEHEPNPITIAWTGTVCSDPPMVSVSLQKSRYSHEILTAGGEFVINLIPKRLAEATDYCGVKSGRDENKWENAELTQQPIAELDYTPGIAESPIQLACKVRQVLELGSHDMFLGEIVTVYVAENLFDEKGAIHAERADLVAYRHGQYVGLDDAFGFFGYSVAEPDVLKRRLKILREDAKKSRG